MSISQVGGGSQAPYAPAQVATPEAAPAPRPAAEVNVPKVELKPIPKAEINVDVEKLKAQLQKIATSRTGGLKTDEALGKGLFGVPTLEWRGRLFWGLDALPMLRAYLLGDAWFDGPDWNAVETTAVGVRRQLS